MTSVPVTNFVYDRQGNVVNVLPTGSSADVVVHDRLGEMTPGVISRNENLLSNAHSVLGVPIMPAQSVFGYANYPTSLDSLDVHRITTATPLVTIQRQPLISGRGEGTPVTASSIVPLGTGNYVPPPRVTPPVVVITPEVQTTIVSSPPEAVPEVGRSNVTRFVRRRQRHW